MRTPGNRCKIRTRVLGLAEHEKIIITQIPTRPPYFLYKGLFSPSSPVSFSIKQHFILYLILLPLLYFN